MASRISMHEKYEVLHLNVTKEGLPKAIGKTGNSAEAVRKDLQSDAFERHHS
jgi:predicted RNA-binding protein YlqC (UPF0109 family)